ncbi:hypothetical protein AWV79_27360 [Cupriavidus sp. UYMMa02A]|nr:hypothetical protein AWV79_27360 [Cupriavidus sp. UYMMa02A]
MLRRPLIDYTLRSPSHAWEKRDGSLAVAYLGRRQIPQELSEFELATFFTYSPKERALIDARRSPFVAVHIGFIRMN